MATYYVRNDGSNTNSGLGPATNQAWATISYALTNMVLTTGVNYLYLAPGIYRESPVVNITPSSTQTLVIQGDPQCTLFSGISSGQVRITNYLNDNTVPTYATAFTCAKQYVTLKNLYFEIFGNVSFTNSNYCSVIQCVFNCVVRGLSLNQGTVRVTPPSNIPSNFTADRCVFTGSQGLQLLQFDSSVEFSHNALITRCLFLCKVGIANLNNPALASLGSGYTVWNCTFMCSETGVSSYGSYTIDKVYVYNSLFVSIGDYGIGIGAVRANTTFENYNRFAVQIPVNGANSGGNSITGTTGISFGYDSINGLPDFSIFSPSNNSPLLAAGLIAGAPTADINNDSWTSGVDIGAFSRTSFNVQSSYQPTERTNNSFTVSPNTTNRSELIYLGAKGLTHTTPSLSASYVRAGAIRTAITLVSQTPNGSWTSGGFCEIDSTNMPGIYRIDVPNAVFVAGAESAMLQLTGTNQTNGAVVHYNMAKVQFDLSQNVPLTNTAHSIGDALNAARAQGFGKWQIVGNTMNIYAEDGITLVKSFNLDSGSYPTQRM